VGPNGLVLAADRHPQKLAALRREFERLGLPPPPTVAVDWTLGVHDVPVDFDRALVDAPCSGSGTLGRRPEILLRLAQEDVHRLAQTSEKILRSVCTRLKPGGRLVFAVCSVLERECEAVVASVTDILTPAPFDAPELGAIARDSSAFRLLPRRHGTDGFFVASLRRT
jgi:16S rRNA (cytosine967-C5)-methyltransferase